MNKAIKISLAAALLATSTAHAGNTDIVHNWVNEKASKAIKALADTYNAQGGTWTESTFEGNDKAYQATKTRVIGGKPPAALMMILGGTAREWHANDMLVDYSAIAKRDNWAAKYPKGVMDTITKDGFVMGVPLTVEVVNFMYANEEVVKASGATSKPKSWNQFISNLDKIKAKGYIPIALGGDTWQMGLVYDHVALSVGGKDLYQGIIDADKATLSSAGALKIFERLQVLRDNYMDVGRHGRKFPDTLSLVVSGKAAYNFMGGWGAGFFKDKKAGQWSCELTPWNNISLSLVEGMVGIKGGSKDVQDRIAKAAIDKNAITGLTKHKGALPALNGIDESGLPTCTQKAAKFVKQSTVAAHWNGEDAARKAVLKDVLGAFFEKDMSAADAQKLLIKKMTSL